MEKSHLKMALLFIFFFCSFDLILSGRSQTWWRCYVCLLFSIREMLCACWLHLAVLCNRCFKTNKKAKNPTNFKFHLQICHPISDYISSIFAYFIDWIVGPDCLHLKQLKSDLIPAERSSIEMTPIDVIDSFAYIVEIGFWLISIHLGDDGNWYPSQVKTAGWKVFSSRRWWITWHPIVFFNDTSKIETNQLLCNIIDDSDV